MVAAYDELFAEGYIAGRHGAGTFVGGDLPTPAPSALAAPDGAARWLRQPLPPAPVAELPEPLAGREGAIEFRPGRPTVEPLPLGVWRQVWRPVLDRLPPNGYGEPAGLPELRLAIARYLGRARGVRCGPEDVVVTTGAAQALDLLARTTLVPGDAAAVENPGYQSARRILAERGARLLPIPVDEDGLCVERLPAGPDAPPIVYVTPSHQYPLGGRLPVARRMALLAWARANDSLIVEDDYDGEFRFDAPPLPALMGLDGGGRVAYVGTFSKALTPTLRAGYLVAPPPLRERVVRLKALIDYHTSWPVQRALVALLAEGHLERHIRRMRRHYAEQRAALRDLLAPVASLARLIGLEAGLHACLELLPGSGLRAGRIAAVARERGVLVATLDPYYLGPPDRQALLLSYGGLGMDDLTRGARILAEIIAREYNAPVA